jgi:hypothetical protein
MFFYKPMLFEQILLAIKTVIRKMASEQMLRVQM